MLRRPAARILILAILVLTLAAPPAWPGPGQSGQSPPPARTGVVEEVETHLVQLDVTVLGPPEAVRGLTRGDFRLKVHTKWIEDFTVDDLCVSEATPQPMASAPGAASEEIARSPLHLLLYFDQAHLTPLGRMRALRMARELAPKLIENGARVTIVSANRGMKTYLEDSNSVPATLAALSELEQDGTQWSSEAAEEEDHLREIDRVSRGGAYGELVLLVKRYRDEERGRTEKALRLFHGALVLFGSRPAPRGVLYFGDRLRRSAGEHYIKYVEDPAWKRSLGRADLSPIKNFFGATLTFDRVVREAAAHQIRVYTVRPEGLGESRLHIREAEDTLAGLALETGGDSFLHGEPPTRIAGKILEDYRCLYLISFVPEGLPTDTPLPVRVELTRPGLKAQTRGTLVVQSPSARRVSRLLAVFVRPGRNTGPFTPRVDIVPLGKEGRRFLALVQVWVPGLATPRSTWDLGASVIASERVQDFARRLEVQGAQVPVAIQRTLRFRPGPFRVVAVAQEVESGLVGSTEMTDSWPRLGEGGVTAGPVAVLQRSRAIIENDGALVREGWLALGEEPPAQPDSEIRFLGLVCRGAQAPARLEARRRLVGATQAPFTPLSLTLEPRECALLQDVAPAGSLDLGRFTYEVDIQDGEGRILAQTKRTFRMAPAPDALRETSAARSTRQQVRRALPNADPN